MEPESGGIEKREAVRVLLLRMMKSVFRRFAMAPDIGVAAPLVTFDARFSVIKFQGVCTSGIRV